MVRRLRMCAWFAQMLPVPRSLDPLFRRHLCPVHADAAQLILVTFFSVVNSLLTLVHE